MEIWPPSLAEWSFCCSISVSKSEECWAFRLSCKNHDNLLEQNVAKLHLTIIARLEGEAADLGCRDAGSQLWCRGEHASHNHGRLCQRQLCRRRKLPKGDLRLCQFLDSLRDPPASLVITKSSTAPNQAHFWKKTHISRKLNPLIAEHSFAEGGFSVFREPTRPALCGSWLGITS